MIIILLGKFFFFISLYVLMFLSLVFVFDVVVVGIVYLWMRILKESIYSYCDGLDLSIYNFNFFKFSMLSII